MTASVIVLALILHFIADFLLQSREMGKNKSSQFPVLLHHIGIQFAVMAVGLMILLDPLTAIAVSAANAVIHGVIDWHIWRGYKLYVYKKLYKQVTSDPRSTVWYTMHPDKQEAGYQVLVAEKAAAFKYWEDHWFYATIGFDQLLHAVTIILALRYIA